MTTFRFRKKRYSIAVLAFGLSAMLAGCGSGTRDAQEVRRVTQEHIKSDANAAKEQLVKVKGITMKGGELSGGDAQGRPLWRISARQIKVWNQAAPKSSKPESADGEDNDNDVNDKLKQLSAQPKRAELTEARAMLYKDGKLDSTLRAPRVVVNYTPTGVRMLMLGGLSAESAGGWTGKRGVVSMTAPRAEVDVKTRKLWASGGVRLKQGKGADVVYASANQLQADTSLKMTRLLGGIKASSADGTFSAQQAAWNWETHRASAEGSVSATHDKTTITGARLVADTAAGRGVLSGGVHATGEKGKASASAVRYDWKGHTLLASGGVLLDKGEATLRANEITADDKFESATASGGVLLVNKDAQISAAQATAHKLGEKDARVVASGSVRLKKGDLTITAGHAQATGLQDKKTLRIVATSGVYASSKDGAVRAGSATWGGGQVVASNGVTLYREGHQLSGSRLVCNDKFTQAVLTGDISGQLAKGETLSAKRMVYRKGQGVVATGGVAARRGEIRLRGDNLTSTPDGSHLLLTGNVIAVSDDGTRVLAKQLRYDRAAQKVYASGDVYLQDPKRGLRQRGRELVADLRLKQATLTDVSGSGKMDVFKDKKLF